MFPRKWLPDIEEKKKAAQFVMTATHVRYEEKSFLTLRVKEHCTKQGIL